MPERLILQDLSLYAKPGQKIAFVGSTGAGKTTITNLINRFYDVHRRVASPTTESMCELIRKDALRSSLGIVLQDTHLFTGTMADNIRFGKLDADAEGNREGRKDCQRRFLYPPPAPGIRHDGHRRRCQPVLRASASCWPLPAPP